MIQFLGQLVRLVWFIVATLLGLVMATIFIFSTLIAVVILIVTGRLSGGPTGVKEYFKRAQSRRKPIFRKGDSGYGRGMSRGNQPKDIIDVQATEIKSDNKG
jgi:hypothetical protein